MENKELYEMMVDKGHDALEEVILDLDDRLNNKSNAIEDKIDELNGNVRELIEVIGELI